MVWSSDKPAWHIMVLWIWDILLVKIQSLQVCVLKTQKRSLNDIWASETWWWTEASPHLPSYILTFDIQMYLRLVIFLEERVFHLSHKEALPKGDRNIFQDIIALKKPACHKVSRSALSRTILLDNDAQASGGAAADWHISGNCILYGFMQISNQKMTTSNCLHVAVQMSLAVSLETLLMKSCIFIYLFLNLLCQNDAATVPICLNIMLDVDSRLAKKQFGLLSESRRCIGKRIQTSWEINSTILDSLAVYHI